MFELGAKKLQSERGKREKEKARALCHDPSCLLSFHLLHRLDVYVWDYLTRRGFTRAAKSLMNEAGMTEAPDVPLKTPQGLLFE